MLPFRPPPMQPKNKAPQERPTCEILFTCDDLAGVRAGGQQAGGGDRKINIRDVSSERAGLHSRLR